MVVKVYFAKCLLALVAGLCMHDAQLCLAIPAACYCLPSAGLLMRSSPATVHSVLAGIKVAHAGLLYRIIIAHGEIIVKKKMLHDS
jgi:hypothetical protein